MEKLQKVVIVGGCGHVGLPLGIVLASHAGLQVELLDVDAAKVGLVNSGTMPFMERGADELLRKVAKKSLNATLDPACMNQADAVITVVGTPVDRHLNPTVGEVYRSIDALLDHMRDGALLVLRSTVYPGVTKLVHDRLHRLKRNVLLAFCPERIAEGNAIEELIKLPQIVSGFDAEAIAAASQLFGLIAPSLIELTPQEAELAKLFTNAWRYANFAISNQFYILAESRGLDFYRIHDAVTRDYPRMRSFAKAGFAAGPCLLKDTLQLAAFSQNNFFLGHAAMLINEGLPMFLVEQIRGHDLSSKRVAILGMAFKAESDDKRDSLSYKLKKLLEVEALEVLCTDPYISEPGFVSLETAVAKADILFVGAPHAAYRELEISSDKIVVDPWNFLPSKVLASTTA
ncbi:MAG: nucleotide sugar dehydrogenase [Candidatus Korobacteraceae bacterium]